MVDSWDVAWSAQAGAGGLKQGQQRGATLCRMLRAGPRRCQQVLYMIYDIGQEKHSAQRRYDSTASGTNRDAILSAAVRAAQRAAGGQLGGRRVASRSGNSRRDGAGLALRR